jgi:hypothetical protein
MTFARQTYYFFLKQTHLAPIASDIKCKVLHLRRSGDMLIPGSSAYLVTPEEVRDFAEWAFGPDGLPGLQLFAYGDFSCQGLFDEYNALFCRAEVSESSPTSFEPVVPFIGPLWSVVEPHMEALGSCAFRSLQLVF